MRDVGHGLCAAGEDDGGGAGEDGLGAEGDGFERGGADFVDGGAGGAVWEGGGEGALTGGVLADAVGGKLVSVAWREDVVWHTLLIARFRR